MTTEDLKTLGVNVKVFDQNSKKLVTVLNVVGFTKNGKYYIPCANEHNYIDDYCIDNLTLLSAEETEKENIYLNRLKEQYKETLKEESNLIKTLRVSNYTGMRNFCLDTELLDFNTIELMEFEVNSVF